MMKITMGRYLIRQRNESNLEGVPAIRGCPPRWVTFEDQMVHFSAIAMVPQGIGGTIFGHHPGHFSLDEHSRLNGTDISIS
jgi:hypothetical protein